jgi:PAS domain S-box-containing protein
LAWVLSLVVLGAAIGLRWLLDPLLENRLALVTLFGAVAFAVWICGYRTGITIAALGYVACAYLFIEPRGQLGLGTLDNNVGLVAYLFTCAVIVVFAEAARRSRKNVTEQHELLRVTLSSIGDAVITTDVDGRVTYLNGVAESLTGWTGEQAHGLPLERIFAIINEATRQAVESPSTRALREGTVVGLANHTLLIRKDGSECAIDDSAAPIRDEAGRVAGCVLIFRDVTEQRRAELERAQQLHNSRLLASIVESSEMAIVGKSLEGIIQSWNAAAERLFGYTADEAVGRHISLVLPPERLHEEETIVATLREGRRVEHFETERLRADGQRIFVSLTISPIRDDLGNVVGASKMVRDITERKRLEDDLRRLAADLSEADRRKDEFLATLAHELRGPLSPLANVLEVWKSTNDAALLGRARETMERQLNQMVRLVDDLLDLNRITHNRFELRRSRVAVAGVIGQAVEACQPLADAAGHELRLHLSPEDCYLDADPARLAQVFGNLLSNACKYTDAGGTITVSVQPQDAEVVVSVKDTGAGIPADELDCIFDMFVQVGRPGAREGLGIGLTLVKRLVDMHGGTVEARSPGEGGGSEFIVRLPLQL